MLTRFINDEVEVMFNRNVAFVLGATFAFGLIQDGCCMKEKNPNLPGRTVSFANPIETNANESSNQTVLNLHRRQESFTDSTEANEKTTAPRSNCPARRLMRPIQRTMSSSPAEIEDQDNKVVDIEQIATHEELSTSEEESENDDWMTRSIFIQSSKKNQKEKVSE